MDSTKTPIIAVTKRPIACCSIVVFCKNLHLISKTPHVNDF